MREAKTLLAVVELTVPPLRERREDIAAIAAAIMDRLADAMRIEVPELHPDAARALLRHAWPGNVRELENVLSRAIVLSNGNVVRAGDLGLHEAQTIPHSRAEFEKDEGSRILSALKATDWNVSEVSRRLGIPRNTLYRKLERYGLRRDA